MTVSILQDFHYHTVGKAVLDSEVQPLSLPGAGAGRCALPRPCRALVEDELAADETVGLGSEILSQALPQIMPGRISPEDFFLGSKEGWRLKGKEPAEDAVHSRTSLF